MTLLLLLLAALPARAADPLDAHEIEATARLVRADRRFPRDALFASMDVAEPPKQDVLAGLASPRRAEVVLHDPGRGRTLEVEVDLDRGKVVSWSAAPGRPPVLVEEYGLPGEILQTDARWVEAMARRGITDVSKVAVDGWAAGPYDGARVVRGVGYLQGDQSNYYGRPIEGVVALIDLDARRVLEVIDHGPVPLAAESQELTPEALGPTRPPLRPLRITQPEGPGFDLDGHEVSWDGWRFRFGLHPREGVVLEQVRYVDGDRERSVLYRGSLSEMAVPYGDPTVGTWSWRSAFDVGEYGLGRLTTRLGLGSDVPENATLIDGVLADATGAPLVMDDVIGIYERDGGLAWRHYDWTTEADVGRRSRELVVVFAAAVGNYDYLFHWVFQQDGTLSMEVVLSGILLAKGTPTTHTDRVGCPGCTGHLVAPHLEAPNHQHFFSFRLDLDVDGTANSLLEAQVEPIPVSAGNPDGNGFSKIEHPLATEAAAQRNADTARSRMWRVVNPDVRNALGNTSGYMLMLKGYAVPYLSDENSTRRRAAFIRHQVWGTRYHDDERWAAGEYPNQSVADDGLSRFVADDESLVGQDVVLWTTIGLTHLPREEEWPVMDAHHAGFTLLPTGFFSRNPTLDLPR